MSTSFKVLASFAVAAFAGCSHHTCDVCDDCGEGSSCNGGCGNNSYHARNYGNPGYAPGYAIPGSPQDLAKARNAKPVANLPQTAQAPAAAVAQ